MELNRGTDRGWDILYIGARQPYPPVRGDAVREFQQIELLSRRHRVTLILPESSTSTTSDIEFLRGRVHELITVPCPRNFSWATTALARATHLPLQVPWFYHPAVGKAVRDVAGRRHFDLIHVHTIRMAPAVEGLEAIPRVLDLCDALSLNLRRRSEVEGGMRGVLAKIEAGRLERYERSLIRSFDASVVCSPVDQDFLGSPPSLALVANGVESYAVVSKDDWLKTRGAKIVFLGYMDYFPNIDAVRYFVREIFPLIRREIPSAIFSIVGANPSEEIRSMANMPGIEVTGTVPDARLLLSQAAVVVCPMRCGAGIQNKVLEAAALARPIVTTSMAVAGIAQLSPGVELAEAPSDFAQKVVRLLRDEDAAFKLGTRGQAIVRKDFSCDSVLDALERVYAEAIANWQRKGRNAAASPASPRA